MRNRQPFVRLALRRMARRRPRKREEILQVLHDRDLLDALTEELGAAAATERGLGDGRFMEFLQFLLDNMDLIFAIIEKLLILLAEED